MTPRELKAASFAVAGSPPVDRSPAATRQAHLRGLVDHHFDFIWRLLRRLGLARADADDGVQQVFMTATQKIDHIAPGRERTFLYGVALRVAANLRRKTQRRREDSEQLVLTAQADALAPDEAAALRQALTLLDDVLSSLPTELARVLVLSQIEQLELAEIAEIENLPQGTVASRLRRARILFKEKLVDTTRGNPFTKEGA